MKLKNVLRALFGRYDLEEVNIIGNSKVIFSGAPDDWRETEVAMILYKKELENAEVVNKMIFNDRKAFIFVAVD